MPFASNNPTPTLTPTPTATLRPLPDVRITHIEYDPPGDDMAGEYVRIKNMAGFSVNMTRWTLKNRANHTFTFPAFTLRAGATVKVWTKSGTNTATNLYWGSGTAIWNNNWDRAYLRDDQGRHVDTYHYGMAP